MQDAVEETLYLLASAGMEASIIEGGNAKISECLDKTKWSGDIARKEGA